MKQAALILLLLGVVVAQLSYSTNVIYNPASNDDLVSRLRGEKPRAPVDKAAADAEVLKALEASLSVKPTMMSTGHMVTELHPPVRVEVGRATKVRRIPHHAGEIIRRVPVGTALVATAATPDMLWLRVGEGEYIATRDCRFTFPDEQRSAPIVPIEPPMDAHVADKERTVVRKIPNTKGKPVGYLAHHDRVRIIGVTPDYTYAQIGHKQFVPITALKAGEPLVRLSPPVTIHIAEEEVDVYDAPATDANIVSTLGRGDVLEAIASTSDHSWLKLSSGAYVHTEQTRMGLPHPDYTVFPKPLMVTVQPEAGAPIIKNPARPDLVLRTLRKGDQLQAFGVTNDFRWLVVAHHRYMPLLSARLVSPMPEEVPLRPPVLIKLGQDENVRHIPDTQGRVMARAKAGDHFEGIAVTDDFTWMKLSDRMWVPLSSVRARRPDPVVRTLQSPITVTIKTDVAVRKRPDVTAKLYGKTLTAGSVVTAIAATPDAEWLQLQLEDDTNKNNKNENVVVRKRRAFIPATSAVLIPVASTAPLTPPVTVIATKDAKLYQAPDTSRVVVERVARGQLLTASATTTDLLWLQLDANKFVQVADVAHVPSLVPLAPAVTFVVATPVKARNIAAFSGMGVHVVEKGTVVVATAASPDYLWVKIGEGRHLPTSALLLHEGEGVDAMAVLRERSGETARKATRGGRLTAETLAPLMKPRTQDIPVSATTPLGAAELLSAQRAQEQMTLGQYNHINANGINRAPTTSPTGTGTGFQRVSEGATRSAIKQVRVVSDTPVMNAPRWDATQVQTLRKGTFVNVFAVDQAMQWAQVGPTQYIRVDYTDVAEQVRKHQV